MLNFFVVFPTFAQTSAKYDDLLTLVIQLISAHIKEDPTASQGVQSLLLLGHDSSRLA